MITFKTSYFIRNPAMELSFVKKSALASYVVKRINSEVAGPYKIARITDPSIFEKGRFNRNMSAIAELDTEVRAARKRFIVALLPVLIDNR